MRWIGIAGAPLACTRVSSKVAEFKRQLTEEVHRMFMLRLEHCLKTKEDIGAPFSQIIKRIFADSSKRGSRQQSRLASEHPRRSPESVSPDCM
jgi:hypothetical protein